MKKGQSQLGAGAATLLVLTLFFSSNVRFGRDSTGVVSEVGKKRGRGRVFALQEKMNLESFLNYVAFSKKAVVWLLAPRPVAQPRHQQPKPRTSLRRTQRGPMPRLGFGIGRCALVLYQRFSRCIVCVCVCVVSCFSSRPFMVCQTGARQAQMVLRGGMTFKRVDVVVDVAKAKRL